MAKEKYLITSDCRLGPNHAQGDRFILNKGETIELDPKSKRDSEVLDLLNLAGRVAVWTPKNDKFIQDEIKRDEREVERIVAERTKSANAGEAMLRNLVKLLQPA